MLVTHDHWDFTHKGPLYLLGLESQNPEGFLILNKARISDFEHPIFNSYYDLRKWTIIDISPAHKSYSKLLMGGEKIRVPMQFNHYSSPHYLVTNEVGLGKAAYWAAGHSKTISKDEEKLFINIIAWLTKLE